MVVDARLMLIDQLHEARHIEDSGFGERSASERTTNPVTQRTAEPARERNREAHFRTVENVVW